MTFYCENHVPADYDEDEVWPTFRPLPAAWDEGFPAASTIVARNP